MSENISKNLPPTSDSVLASVSGSAARVEVVSAWDGETWKPLKGDYSEADAEWLATYYRLIKKRKVRVLMVKPPNVKVSHGESKERTNEH